MLARQIARKCFVIVLLFSIPVVLEFVFHTNLYQKKLTVVVFVFEMVFVFVHTKTNTISNTNTVTVNFFLY